MLTVLIVEDDPMVAQINKQYLETIEGFHLAGIVSTGDQAERFLQSADVSLVLLDVFMPSMDGMTLLKKIREHWPDVDVIMVTAAKSAQDIQSALRLGVIDYIVKPFTLERFQSALIAYQERARLLAEEEELDQLQIDENILFPRKSDEKNLPKGIDEETLGMVKEAVTRYGGEFKVKDLVPLVGLSRVSLKKYLDHLESVGFIKGNLAYMPSGRPPTSYHLVADPKKQA